MNYIILFDLIIKIFKIFYKRTKIMKIHIKKMENIQNVIRMNKLYNKNVASTNIETEICLIYLKHSPECPPY